MNKKQIDKEIRKILQRCLDLRIKGVDMNFDFSANVEAISITLIENGKVVFIERCYINPNDICFDANKFKVINEILDKQFRKVEN